MFLRLNEFKEHLKVQNKRDSRVIKKVEEMFASKKIDDVKFCKKAEDISAAMEGNAYKKSLVMKAFLDNFWCKIFFDEKFNHPVVVGVLKDPEFIAFLLKARLMNRYINMDYDTNDVFKLRLYVAILCFDEYKKNKWCMKKQCE